MKIGVRILPRPEVLDAQGRAVAKTLQDHGHKDVQCRVGKYVELEIAASNAELGLEEAKKIAEFVLYNPLIETFELEMVTE